MDASQYSEKETIGVEIGEVVVVWKREGEKRKTDEGKRWRFGVDSRSRPKATHHPQAGFSPPSCRTKGKLPHEVLSRL